MLKDIKETPDALKAALKAYFDQEKNIKNIKIPVNEQEIEKIYITASGSSRNAANFAKFFIEKTANIPVIVDYAGEFAHRSPVLNKNDLIISLSQSGETADVLAALKKARTAGISVFSITNNETSSIHKLADSGMLILAGTEESIPATKSFTCQLICLYIFGIHLAEKRNSLPKEEIQAIKEKIFLIPDKISLAIEEFSEKINPIALKIKDFNSLIILGRGQNWAFAEEAALKIQETCYINAFGFPTGEFMHGHIAVLDEKSIVLSIQTRAFDDLQSYNLALKNTQEIKKKRAPFLITIGHDSSAYPTQSDIFIEIKDQDEIITAFICVIILQLITNKTAELLGRDVISPRSLNKALLNE
ncbi:MAG TPA: SIS domain-containing protein [Candidatus Gastranaerophilales bacterium]|nr:SIS domain-containing protein [Candidatus Gastranaerophilales bacterium]